MSGSPDSGRACAELEQKYLALENELKDLQTLYENNLEHGTSLENELISQNQRMQNLQNKMKKYLSPQLYEALLGGSTDPSNRGHRRKKLAIYFSDMVGFSDLTDSIEPELLSDVLNSYLNRMAEIAIRHGGTVDKFIGDAILVFFGDPESIDDVTHVRKCTAMALEMREELYRLRELWKHKGITRTLQVRAGINFGYCTVGNFGSERRMDYTVIGGQVNLASRLQAAAPPDRIYLSSAAYALVEDFVEARSIGTITVKGIHTPVEVFELLALKSGVGEQGHTRYLKIEGARVSLSPLDMALTQIPEDELQWIQKALCQALVSISSYRKPKG